jgi:23S rRNA (guanosine2251-2'-O)-methyltransferase
VLAYVDEALPVTLDDVLKVAETRNEPPFLCLLDGIEDPQNLGAVVRSADAAGVHGVVVPERGAAHLSPGVYKASAGAANVVPVVRVSSLANAIETLHRREVYVVGADATAEKPLWAANLRGAVAFVIGSEQSGLSRLVRERCDELVGIPMRGQVSSLNASVAASLLFFEKLRQEAAAP